MDERFSLSVAEFGLCLALELRLGELDGDDGCQALADVVTGNAILTLLDESPSLTPPINGVGESGTEAFLVGSALDGVDGVGEGVDAGGVRSVPLHRNLQTHTLLGTVGLQGDDGGVDDVAGPREESDVVLKALLIEEVLVNRVAVLISVVGTAVGEHDTQTFIKEGHFTETVRQGLVVENDGIEDLVGGLETHRGAFVIVGAERLKLLQRTVRLTEAEGLTPVVAVSSDLDDEVGR